MAFYRSKVLTVACTAALGIALIGLKPARSSAADKGDDSDITKIMKKAFKGPGKGGPGGASVGGPKKQPSLVGKAIDGTATDEDLKTLLGYTQDLAKAKPPKGDQTDWDDRTGKIVKAIEALSNKDKSGSALLKTSSNCKECHTKQKED